MTEVVIKANVPLNEPKIALKLFDKITTTIELPRETSACETLREILKYLVATERDFEIVEATEKQAKLRHKASSPGFDFTYHFEIWIYRKEVVIGLRMTATLDALRLALRKLHSLAKEIEEVVGGKIVETRVCLVYHITGEYAVDGDDS